MTCCSPFGNQLLKKEGYNIINARNGELAISLVRPTQRK
jgi:hypothetical protein